MGKHVEIWVTAVNIVLLFLSLKLIMPTNNIKMAYRHDIDKAHRHN